MRRRVLLIAACLFGPILGTLWGQVDPFGVDFRFFDSQTLQIIGWSVGEDYYAVRHYYLRSKDFYLSEAGVDLPQNCEGYITHRGQKYDGGMSIYIWHGTEAIEGHVIHEVDKCTPTSDATQRLMASKKAMRKWRIQLANCGEELFPTNGKYYIEDSVHGPYFLEYRRTLEKKNASEAVQRLTGKHEIFLVKDCTRSKVLGKVIDEVLLVGMGATIETGLESVWISPSKRTILVFCYRQEGNYSFKYRRLWLLGTLHWLDGQLKQDGPVE